MPAHDWARVTAGTFHDFHLAWIAELRRALNGGLLPFPASERYVPVPLERTYAAAWEGVPQRRRRVIEAA